MGLCRSISRGFNRDTALQPDVQCLLRHWRAQKQTTSPCCIPCDMPAAACCDPDTGETKKCSQTPRLHTNGTHMATHPVVWLGLITSKKAPKWTLFVSTYAYSLHGGRKPDKITERLCLCTATPLGRPATLLTNKMASVRQVGGNLEVCSRAERSGKR